MATQKPPTEAPPSKPTSKPISQDEFARPDHALTEALDDLEKDVFPARPKPAPIGGMF